MRLIDANSLMPLFVQKAYTIQDRHGVKIGEHWLLDYTDIKDVIDNAQTVEPTFDLFKEMLCAECEKRPQGEWLFKEIDENYHVYGQCSVCKEINRIGKACRSCGAEMRGGKQSV